MKLSTYVLSIIAGCALSIGCQDPGAADAAATLGAGKWMLQSMTQNGKPIPLPNGTEITIAFNKNEFSGSSGCNSLDGAYRAQKGGQMTFTAMSGTEMACMEPAGIMQVEQSYLDVISKTKQYATKAKQLLLSDGTVANQLVFVPYKSPAPMALAGTVWVLDTFEEGDGVSVAATPVLPNFPITLQINDQQASGSGGCNRFNSEVVTDPGALRFGPLAMTKKACEPQVMQQEQRFAAALEKVTRYNIASEHLVLTNEDDTLILHFSAQLKQ